MTSRIEQLPSSAIQHVAFALEPKEIFTLALCSKTLFNQLSSAALWRSKTVHDFGDLFRVYSVLRSVSLLDLDADLDRFATEPSDWRSYYMSKVASIDHSEDDRLVDQADHEYAEALKMLKTLENDQNVPLLGHVASRMVQILDKLPGHAGCYYILGFILYVLNRLEEALVLLQMAQQVGPDFEPIEELMEEVTTLLNGYKGDQDETPVLDNDSLSPQLLHVLVEIFDKFDEDKDQALRPEELRKFIFATNGVHPPAPFLRQMGQRFGANQKGWLTRDGFLAFYLEQTLQDPAETRNDISVHGYDPRTLGKTMEE